jgi:hypothetical protein
VSLDKDKVKKTLLQKIDDAKDYKTTIIEPAAKERLQRFRADPAFYAKKFPNLADYDVADPSVSIAVERIIAALMKIVFGNEDVGSIQGRTAEDDPNADVMQQLVNWQIEYENKGYLIFNAWFKECLYQLYSIVKVTQHRDVEQTEEVITIPLAALPGFQSECEQNDAEVVQVEQNSQDARMVDATVVYSKLTKNYPEIENVPASELIWTPNARSLKEADLVGHVKLVTIDHLRRNIKAKGPDGLQVGMYDKQAVDEVAKVGSSPVTSDLELTRQDHFQEDSYDTDDPNRKVTIIECYIKYDINGDGLLEDVIATICDDTETLLRCEENEDGLPFCIISPLFDPYRIVPERGSMDNLGQWQDLLTIIIRLTIQNLALNNNPQQLVQTSVFTDFNQVLDNSQFIEINGPVNEAMQPVAQVPLAPYTLDLIELVKGWGEEASNVNRYNQGIDANSLNKTATGMQLLVNQGSQALELIMRNIAETGLHDLFMRFIFLNQKYIDQDQVIRLTDKDITVNKTNLEGDFDYIVNSGMGAGAKETDTQNMQTLISMYPQLIPAGLATTQNAYNAVKKYLSLIGIKDYGDYITDPSQMPPKASAGPNATEQIKVAFPDLPITAKVQLLTMLGLQVTPQDFINDLALQQQQETGKAAMAVQTEQAKQQARTQADITTQRVKAQADIAKIHAQEAAKAGHNSVQHVRDLQKMGVQSALNQREAVVNGQIRATTGNPAGSAGQAGRRVSQDNISANQSSKLAQGAAVTGTGADHASSTDSPIVY